MAYLVRGYPLRRPIAEFMAFVAELQGPRREQLAAMFRRYGVVHETWRAQVIADETWILALTRLEDPDAAAPICVAATDEFTAWYKARVRELTGIDPDVAPVGPPTVELFTWVDEPLLDIAAE